jgi:hypothetical protein
MSGEMVSLAMSNSCGGVGVRCEVMEFGDPIVRALRHSVLLGKQQSIAPISSQFPDFRGCGKTLVVEGYGL